MKSNLRHEPKVSLKKSSFDKHFR